MEAGSVSKHWTGPCARLLRAQLRGTGCLDTPTCDYRDPYGSEVDHATRPWFCDAAALRGQPGRLVRAPSTTASKPRAPVRFHSRRPKLTFTWRGSRGLMEPSGNSP